MFLKYLLDNKLISSDQALEATMNYLEGMPSLLKIIAKENVLSSDKLIQLYCKAGVEKRSFLEVFRADSGLTADDIKQVLETQQMNAKSLGQILVEKGFIAQDKWEAAIRDYKKSTPAEAIAEKPVQAEATKSEEKATSIPSGISAAALESLMEVQGLDASQLQDLESQVTPSPVSNEAVSMSSSDAEEANLSEIGVEEPEVNSSEEVNISIYAEELFEHYNEEMQSELLVMANRYRLKKREKDLALFHQNMAKILSLVKLSEFSYLEKLITPYETMMSRMMDNTVDLPQDWDLLVSDMLELCWKFRVVLKQEKSEAHVLNDNEVKKKYIENIKSVMAYLKR